MSPIHAGSQSIDRRFASVFDNLATPCSLTPYPIGIISDGVSRSFRAWMASHSRRSQRWFARQRSERIRMHRSQSVRPLAMLRSNEIRERRQDPVRGAHHSRRQQLGDRFP